MIDLDEEMQEFFVRSVDRNTATGIPPPLEIQRSEQQVVVPRRVVEEVKPPRVTLSESLPGSPPIPTLSSVQPNNGRLAGGGTVRTILGTNFIDGAKIYFDNVLATSITYIDSEHLTCLVPAYTHGSPTNVNVDVKVVNVAEASNTFQAIKTNGYTYYIGPSVSSLSPNHGPGAGGTPVTVTGSNFIFSSGYVVRFGTLPVASTRTNSTTLTCVTPAHAAGAVNISVIAPDADHQIGALVSGYTYDAPGGTPPSGGSAIFICTPSSANMQHNGSVVLQIKVITDSSGTVDTTYNGTIHPTIMGISSNASASFSPPTPTIVAGQGTVTVQGFLVDLHASGSLYINFTESLFTNNAVFEGYIARFFNP